MTSDGPVPVDVFFDYTCPFAYRAHRWLRMVDLPARWRPFSLLEHNYRGDGPPVWRLPERADDISLLLFAGHSWVRAQGADLDAYRDAAFHAWHETSVTVELDDVVGFATAAGAEGDEETLREHFHDAETEHDAARVAGVFGSPTLVFAAGRAAFVKLAAVPSAEEAEQILAAARATGAAPAIEELKQVAPAGQEEAQGGAPVVDIGRR